MNILRNSILGGPAASPCLKMPTRQDSCNRSDAIEEIESNDILLSWPIMRQWQRREERKKLLRNIRATLIILDTKIVLT